MILNRILNTRFTSSIILIPKYNYLHQNLRGILARRLQGKSFYTKMDDIQKELKDVQKKIDDIEKKQEMLKRIQELDRLREEKQAKRPTGHSYEK